MAAKHYSITVFTRQFNSKIDTKKIELGFTQFYKIFVQSENQGIKHH